MSGSVPKLIGQKEPVKDQEILCTGPVTVGRDPTANSFPINHPSISRKHGRVFLDGSAWSLEDFGSSNGTFLNEVRIQKVRLKDGDVVRFGDVPFKFNLAKPEPVPVASKPAASDGFEATLVMSPASRPKAEPSPPSDFEGTVFGGQAPVFFANQMQKDTSQQGGAKVATADAPPQIVYQAPSSSQTPNFFLLKIKAILFVLALFGALALFIIYLIHSSAKSREVKDAVRGSREKVQDFISNNESKVLQPDARIPTFKGELASLEDSLKEVKEKLDKFKDADKEEVNQLKNFKERLEFLIFERKIAISIADGDREGADRLAEDFAINGTEDQKGLAPMAKELLRFQHFRKNFPLKPSVSSKTPERKEIEDLTAGIPILKDHYYKSASNPLVSNTHFAVMAKDSIDNDEALIRLWKKFFADVDNVLKAADGDQKKNLTEKFKKEYPNLESYKMLQ